MKFWRKINLIEERIILGHSFKGFSPWSFGREKKNTTKLKSKLHNGCGKNNYLECK
jgi:hypothetical protein